MENIPAPPGSADGFSEPVALSPGSARAIRHLELKGPAVGNLVTRLGLESVSIGYRVCGRAIRAWEQQEQRAARETCWEIRKTTVSPAGFPMIILYFLLICTIFGCGYNYQV